MLLTYHLSFQLTVYGIAGLSGVSALQNVVEVLGLVLVIRLMKHMEDSHALAVGVTLECAMKRSVQVLLPKAALIN